MLNVMGRPLVTTAVVARSGSSTLPPRHKVVISAARGHTAPQSVCSSPEPTTQWGMSQLSAVRPVTNLTYTGPATMGLNQVQSRYLHTSSVREDQVKVPDFSAYRRKGSVNPRSRSLETGSERKGFNYTVGTLVGAASTLYLAKNTVQTLLIYMNPQAADYALAKIEVDLTNIPEGKNCTFKWQGKPVFVRHRTADEIAQEADIDISALRHKQTDAERVKQPEWLVCVAVCTHLGCVPISGVGEYGGYYCPCHGSVYDCSGRIRKGPAPENLEVPNYEFEGDKVIIG